MPQDCIVCLPEQDAVIGVRYDEEPVTVLESVIRYAGLIQHVWYHGEYVNVRVLEVEEEIWDPKYEPDEGEDGVQRCEKAY